MMMMYASSKIQFLKFKKIQEQDVGIRHIAFTQTQTTFLKCVK